MSRLTGTGPLVRLALRVDRARLPVWVLAVTVVVTVTAASFAGLYPDEASRQGLARGIASNPALLALYGPLVSTSIGGLTVWRQGVIMLVLVGLMNLLAVVRHTRAAEETGRLELVGAAVVGRDAPLAAALATAAIADLAVMVGVGGGLVATSQPVAGSLALGTAVALAGLTMAAVAAVTAQLTDSARTASGLAGAVLGVSFVLRAAGDASRGGGLAWLSWASPMGWAQQVHPFGGERWWVLTLPLVLAVASVALAVVLRHHRDLGGGMLAARPGPARASRALATPVALAWRLQRGALGGWLAGIVILGAVFGALSDAITDLFADTPQLAEILARLGGTERVVDAFLGAILGVLAVLATVPAIGSVLRLRTEELEVHAEPVLAAAVTRLRWAASHLVLAAGWPVVVLAASGASAGLASGLATGSGAGRATEIAAAALAHLPAVWVVVGIAALVTGLWPRATAAAYGALAAFVLLGQVGEALQLDQAWLDLSPYAHVPQVPAAAVTWTPLVWLSATAAALVATGLAGLRRRDIG